MEVRDKVYKLEGKKIKQQKIEMKNHIFIFLDDEIELSFKKINKIPMITEEVKKLAE